MSQENKNPEESELENIMKDIRDFIEDTTKVVLDKVTTNETKKLYLRSFSNICIFLFYCEHKDVMYKSVDLNTYNNSVNMMASVLGIESDKFHFIIDLLTKDPTRIFRFEDKLPKIDPAKLNFREEISKRRLNLIAELLDMSRSNVKRTAALWTYPQNMIDIASITFKSEGKEDNILKSLAKDIMGVDPQFLHILMKLISAYNKDKLPQSTKEYLSDFLVTLLHNRASIFPSYNNDKFPQGDYDWNKVDMNKIWRFKSPDISLFISSVKELANEKNRKNEENKEDEWDINESDKESYNKTFMLLIKISEFLVSKNPSYYSNILKINEKSLLLKGIIDIFEQKNVDCIMTLVLISNFNEKGALPYDTRTKQIIFSAILLFNKNVLKNTFRQMPKSNQLFQGLTKLLKRWVNRKSELNELNSSMNNMYHVLFEAGLFDELCENIFKNFKDHFKKEIDHKRLIRAWLHINSENPTREKIVNNLLNIFKTDYTEDLKVLISIIKKDTVYEKLLEEFFTSVKIPPNLGLNILRILDPENPKN